MNIENFMTTKRMKRRALATPARLSVPPTARNVPQSVLFALLLNVLLAMFVAASPASADENDQYKVAQGLGVYLGILPAGIVRGHLESHPEARMHGGALGGRHEYHIIIAVFDTGTGRRVEDAKVTATVSGLGDVGQNQFDLEPMTIAGTITYGNFVDLPGKDQYDIALDISVPGRKAPVQVDFIYQHLP